jgi:hypothetical protein
VSVEEEYGKVEVKVGGSKDKRVDRRPRTATVHRLKDTEKIQQ